MDPNLASELSKWVDVNEGLMTLEGSHEVCVQGEPCIAAIHAYYQAFVQQGCAERLQLESTYKLAWSLE
jgi:vacuolar-type H+-ATPase subunit B/Vma2